MKSKKVFIIWMLLFIIIIIGGVLYNVKNKNILEEDNYEIEEDNYEIEEDSYINNTSNEIINISTIDENVKGKKVTIQGSIIKITTHKNGHLFLTVKDDSGSILVSIFSDKNIDKTIIKKDIKYKISGEVNVYNGELEIIPQNQDDISILDGQSIDNISISKDNIGKKISIYGKVLSVYNHPKGHIFLNVLNDNDEEITIPIFNSLGYNREFNSGDYIKITGQISEYNGKLQVVPNSKSDIEVVSSESSKNIELLSISEITEDMRGNIVQVSAIPIDIVEKKGHMYFYLKDNESKIKAVLFRADGNEVLGRKNKLIEYSNLGKKVRVLGTIDIYNGQLEIIIDKVFNQD